MFGHFVLGLGSVLSDNSVRWCYYMLYFVVLVKQVQVAWR